MRWLPKWLCKDSEELSPEMKRLTELDALFDKSVRDLTGMADSLTEEAVRTNEFLKRKLSFVEKKMSVISDMVDDLIIVKTVNRQWVSINSCACHLFGVSSVDCIGKTNDQLAKEFPTLRKFITNLDEVEKRSWDKKHTERVRCVYESEAHGAVELDIQIAPIEGEGEDQKEIIVVGKLTTPESRNGSDQH